MLAEAAEMTAGSDPVPMPKTRLSARLIDRRTIAWRRRCELVEKFKAALGNVDAVTADRIADAAEMRVIAELARARFLAGEPVPLEEVTRIENAARRAEQLLGLGRGATADTGTPPVDPLVALVRRMEPRNG